MIPKVIYLDLSWDVYKITEPSIYELFQIESLSEDRENIKKNIETIFEILKVPKKYLLISSVVIEKVLKWFTKRKKSKWWNDYFLGILWILAHHNFMDLKSFMKTYCLSDLSELLKVREYYFNIINDKASDNVKFHDKTKESEEENEKIEEFIRKMTSN